VRWKKFGAPVIKNEWVYAPITLIFIAIIGLWGQFSGVSHATFDDNTYMYLPLMAHASKVFAQGEYPYWVNTLLGGLPLFDTPQLTVDYPFYFLWKNIYRSAFEALVVVHFITLLHYFILLTNSYILLRVLRLAPLAAFFGAAFFAFSPNMLSYSFAVTLIAPYSWIPLFVSAVILTLQDRPFALPFFLGVFAVVMLVLSAPSLPFIHCLYISGLITASHVAACLRNKQIRACCVSILKITAMGITAFIIVSPYLVSEFLSMSGFIRWVGADSPAIVGNTKIPFKSFLLGQLSREQIFDVIIPSSTHHIIGNAFIGLMGCALSFLSFNTRRTLPFWGTFTFLTLWGLLSAFGSNFGFAYINYNIPFINLMREPGRHIFIFIFGASILAASGFNYLLENMTTPQKRLATTFNTFISLAVLGAFLGPQMLLGVSCSPSHMAFAAIGVFCLLGYSIFSKKRIRGFLAIAIAASTVAANLIAFPMLKIPLSDGDYFSEWNLRSHRVLSELAKTENIKNYRVIFNEHQQNQRWSMNAVYHDIRSFNAYMNPMPSQQFSDLYHHGGAPGAYQELLGTKYVLCDRCSEIPQSSFSFEREVEGYKIFRSDRAFPRYKMVHELEGTYNNDTEFQTRLRASYDFLKRVQIRSLDVKALRPFLKTRSRPAAKECSEIQERSTHNKLTLSLSCPRPGILLLNEYFSPNWQVKIVHGNTAGFVDSPIFRVNLTQIGIPVHKGASLIEIAYKPQPFQWLRFTGKLLVICLCLLFLYILSRRRLL
jgi:hypothetical protein